MATYLREHALDWWQQIGSKTLPPDANFTAFSEAFLARYVKPSDSQKARKELPTLRQSDNECIQCISGKHSGHTFLLNNGRHPRLPSDLNLSRKPSKNPFAVDFIGNIEKGIAKAKVCLQAAQQRQKKYADQNRVDLFFNVGEYVWLNSTHIAIKAVGLRKLLAQWLGPFKVTAVISPVNYKLKVPAHYRIHDVFHVSMLRLAHDNGAGKRRPPTTMIEGEEEFELEEILAHRPAHKNKSDSGIQYLVHWVGYGPMDNSWEPERLLKQRAPEALDDYWDKVAVVQAQSVADTDTGLAPSAQSRPATRGRGANSSRGRDQNRGRGRGRGRGTLKPVSKKLKR